MTAMLRSKHEVVACPRCGATFECKANNPVHCQCSQVTLSKDLAEELTYHYDDCLCINCLREIRDNPSVLTTVRVIQG